MAKRLSKNIGINMFTKMLPILVGVITLPILINGLGDERTGILNIIWLVIGFSSVFDLGLGRALTQLVSKKLAAEAHHELPSIITTTLTIIATAGLIPAILLSLFAPALVSFINVSPEIYGEAVGAVYWLAASVPAMLLITCQTGILQAHQEFGKITLLNLPSIFGNFIAPVIMLSFTTNLSHVVAVMVLSRIAMAGLFFLVTRSLLDYSKAIRPLLRLEVTKPLLHFGKWVTLSNIVNPMMTYLSDKMILANLLTAQVASYYVIPSNMLTKMSVVSWAVMGVMFPAMSAEYDRDRKKSSQYYWKSLGLVFALLIVPVAVIAIFSKPLLAVWINPDFAEKSALVTSLSVVALFIYSLNIVPFSFIQASGDSRFVALVQLVELPLLLGGMTWAITTFGITGAPLSMLALFLLDGLILQLYAAKLLKKPMPAKPTRLIGPTPSQPGLKPSGLPSSV